MTKAEKQKLNQQLGQIWMELRALKNSDRKNIRTGPDWIRIQKRHRDVIEGNEELTQTILEKYPRKLEDIKDLRYTADIEKTIACLNLISPSES